jgi:putative ABC transport system permease protein
MFGNYLAAALRNLGRNKLNAAINILGLAVGFAAALLIALFIRDELSYDRFIPGAASVYSVSTTFAEAGRAPMVVDTNPADLADALKLDFPSIQAIARLNPDNVSLRHGEIEANEQVYWADPQLFAVLHLPVVAGEPANALRRPDGIVMTRRMARKYFGRDTPIGETLRIDRHYTAQVTAVLDDFPATTNLSAEIFISGAAPYSGLSRLDAEPQGNGFLCSVHILFRLNPGASVEQLRRDLSAFLHRHRQLGPGDRAWLTVTPLSEVHLNPSELSDFKPGIRLATLHALAAVGALITLAASINFVNLTTARASRRAAEIGVRKVVGAEPRDLMVQFIGESLLHVGLGMAAAIGLVALVLPWFNAFLDRRIVFDAWRDPGLAGLILGLVLIVGTLAGSYPAFVLSRFRPALVLRSRVADDAGSTTVRQTLVVVQFAILIGLLLATAVIYRQTAYALNEALRLDRDQVVVVWTSCANAFKDKVRALPGVRAAACSSWQGLNIGQLQYAAQMPDGATVHLFHIPVDFGFFELYGLRPLAGRFFSPDHGADAVAADPAAPFAAPVVINQRAARLMGFATPRTAIGRTVTLTDGERDHAEPSEIIGVVEDFAVKSVRQPVDATVYFVDSSQDGLLSVKLRGRDVPETLTAIDRLWREFGEPLPIRRVFLDQYVEGIYRDILRQGGIFAGFAGVAMVIACLGLFALSSFTAERRTKEIGIRKALGAGRGDIVRLFLWQFTKPVLWANVLALPIGAALMTRWLDGFAYHVEVTPWLLLVAAGLALAIAWVTVAVHASLVARTSPATALHHE